MGIALVPFYIKYLGIESYGLIGIFAILQGSLTLLDMGMKPALSREMARFTAGAHDISSIRVLLRSVELIGAGTAIAIFLCVWAGSGWLAADWVKSPNLPIGVVRSAFEAMGVLCALRFIENIYASSIVGLQRQVLESVISGGMAVIRGVGAIGILAWVSPTVEAFFLWQCCVSLITVPLLAGIVYHVLPPSGTPARFSWTALTGIWRFASGVMAITLLALILTQIDKILLSRLLPLKVFAYYALAGVLTTSLYMLTGPISAAFYPKFTQLATRGDVTLLTRTYHQAAQLTTVAVGAAAVVMIIFADSVLRLWTGNLELAQHVSPLVRVLAFGTLLNGLMGIPYQLQLAHGWTALTIKSNVVAVLLVVPAIFIVVPRFGAVGAAWIWAMLNAAYLSITVYFMHQRLLKTEKWRWYWQDLLVPLVAASIAALACRSLTPNDANRLVELGVLIASACCVLAVTALACPLIRPLIASHLADAVRHLNRKAGPARGGK